MTAASTTTLEGLIQHVRVLRDGSPPRSTERTSLNAHLTALRVFASCLTEDHPPIPWGSLPLEDVLKRVSVLSAEDTPEGVKKETFVTYVCRAVHTIREYLELPVQRRRKQTRSEVRQSIAPADPVTSLLRLIGEHSDNPGLQIKLAEVLLTTLRQRVASPQPDLPSRV